MQEITSLSAKKIAELIKNKKISCVEVMQAHLDRIAKINPLINAIVQQLTPEQALKEAQIADDAIARKKPLGKLHGIPITIKDGRKVKGFLTTLGAKSPKNCIATEDGTLVKRLRDAGAIILGITNVPAFLVSAETDNLLYGRTNNPYDLSRTAGGSSGGQCAITAAGGIPFGIGGDSGGSLRQPAHNCGVTTLKPTQGLFPLTGLFPQDGNGMVGSIDTQGPIARYVEDLILSLPVLAGPDDQDPSVVPISLKDPNQVDLKSLRIAYFVDNGVAQASEDVANTIKQAANALSEFVALVNEDCPHVIQQTTNSPILELYELYFYGGDHGKWLIDFIQSMGVKDAEPMTQYLLNKAKQCEFSANEIRRRFVEVDQFKMAMLDFMHHYDAIICPIATVPAGLHGKVDVFRESSYTFPYNVTGWPAVVVRCGTSKEGLPIGVQIAAKNWREDIALAVAKKLEEIFGGWQAPKL
jgi:amidase